MQMEEKPISLMRLLRKSTVICHKREKNLLPIFNFFFIIMSNKICGSTDLMCEHKEVGMSKDALFRFFVQKMLNLKFHFLFFPL